MEPPLATTPSPSNANYKLDVKKDDKLFTDAHPEDLIIVIMGLTGAGKSTFINRFCGKDVREVNHGLKSCTTEIGVATSKLPPNHPISPGRRVVLVDTPGFDDTYQPEGEILRKVCVWLASVYDSAVPRLKVAGLVYLHSIGHNRMAGSGILSHDVFHEMCGPIALQRVVMASTQWGTIADNPEAGPVRERDLQVFWNKTLRQGAVYRRVGVQDPKGDAQAIIDHILEQHAVAVRIQKELVELNKRVAETEAAQTLRKTLEGWLGDAQTEGLSQEKEEHLKKFPVEPGFVDWVKGLFRIKSHPDLTRVISPTARD